MNKENKESAVRVQTSILNGLEKKALVYLAERQPQWMTSNILTGIGVLGSIIIGLGYILAQVDIYYLWLCSLGYVINWYGDSLDGTLARVRKLQRPVFGYYLDHTVDILNELCIFIGLGLSGLIHLNLALALLTIYFMFTINVSINAHLRNEFCLTYGGMGPTEFRVVAILINLVYMYCPVLSTWSIPVSFLNYHVNVGSLDIIGTIILVILIVLYLGTIIKDTKYYNRIDPKKKD